MGVNLKWLKDIISLPPGNMIMVGNTVNSLIRNVIDPITSIIGKRNVEVRLQKQECSIFGRNIWIQGADKEDAYKRIEGESLLRAYVDEWSRVPKNFTKTLMSRLSDPGACAYGTLNPDTPAHYLYRDYILRARELGIAVWKFTLKDNPYLDPEYVKAIIAENPPGTVFYDRNILGNWVAASGLVYANFDRRLHVVHSPPVGLAPKELRVGIDYGTHNPTAFVSLEKYLVPGRARPTWYATGEYYWDSQVMLKQKTDAEYSVDLAEYLAGRWKAPDRLKVPGSRYDGGDCVGRVVGGRMRLSDTQVGKADVRKYPSTIEVDPSASSYILQLNRDGMRKARAADNDVLNGIRKVATMVSAGELVITENCPWLIQSMENYSWDPKALNDEVVKEGDHPVDALRYVVNSL